MKIDKLDSNMAITPIGDKDYQWLDPKTTEEIRISGFAWFEKEQLYRRMPEKKDNVSMPEAIDDLANCCAGGQLTFQTDSTRLAIHAKFSSPHGMNHMTAIGELGFDCYINKIGDMQFAAISRFGIKEKEYSSVFFEDIDKKMRTITINFPLYNSKLKQLMIGIEPNSSILAPVARKHNKKVVIYGTSITQGGCASRPGMCYTNILSRDFDAEFINLGFSGNGKGQPDVMEHIASIKDMGLLVVDYEANIQNDIFDNLGPAIDIIRAKHKTLPIIILSRIGYGQENIRLDKRAEADKRREFQKDFVAKRQNAGDKNIFFVDGSKFFTDNPGEYAVDGCHTTDFGFYVMAKALLPNIKKYFNN